MFALAIAAVTDLIAPISNVGTRSSKTGFFSGTGCDWQEGCRFSLTAVVGTCSTLVSDFLPPPRSQRLLLASAFIRAPLICTPTGILKMRPLAFQNCVLRFWTVHLELPTAFRVVKDKLLQRPLELEQRRKPSAVNSPNQVSSTGNQVGTFCPEPLRQPSRLDKRFERSQHSAALFGEVVCNRRVPPERTFKTYRTWFCRFCGLGLGGFFHYFATGLPIQPFVPNHLTPTFGLTAQSSDGRPPLADGSLGT